VKDQSAYLDHIVDAIEDIQEYTSVGRDAFMSDRMRQDAVIRKLEIIGEAVKNLSDAIKQLAPSTPWRKIAGMRDRLTHEYFGVDLGLVWTVVERELSLLRTAVDGLIVRLRPSSSDQL
jgi:uncharacterized protein with HEPN domain